MLIQTVKMVLSPFNPSIEVVGSMLLEVHPPYDSKSLLLVINPNIIEYQDKPQSDPGIEIRQVMVSQDTDETQRLEFHLDSANEKIIDFRRGRYKIKLLNIGKESLQGQDFPYFEFFIEEQN